MKHEKQQTLEELISEMEAYFKKLSYSNARMRTYRNGWKLLNKFMLEHSIVFYKSIVGDAFIKSIIGRVSYEKLSRRKKDIIRSANVLTEYQTTGVIKFRSTSKQYVFKGEIGKIILDFLAYSELKGLSKATLDSKRLYLYRFLDYLNTMKIYCISNIDKKHIFGFINGLAFYSKATIHCMLCSLRGFLRYLFNNQHTNIDLSYFVPKSGYKKQSQLPTTYTKDEIEQLIHSVDRSSPKGKRDLAMILLAARLGLRASDFCGLKFESVHWETNTIFLTQKKTKKNIELPLLVEVGNAIIDYLKYGRPVSDLPYIFLRVGQPYERLKESTLHSIVTCYLRRAGIGNINKKKHGPHALRHSLAGLLLEKKTPLPVISEVLGHANTESTKSYLRIDLDSLRQCTLEVLPLNSPHYKEVE